MNRKTVILHAFCLFFLAACSTSPANHNDIQSTEGVRRANQLTRQGNHQQAAHLYQELANTRIENTAAYTLLAVESFLKAGDERSAQNAINRVDLKSISEREQAQLNLIYAQLSLRHNQTEQALYQLNSIQINHLNRGQKIEFFQSLAFAQSLMGEPLKSVQARVEVTPLLITPEQKQANQRLILKSLGFLSSKDLILYQPAPPSILGGWMALSLLLQQTDSDQAFYQWRQNYPQHPAQLEQLNTIYQQQSDIAVSHRFKKPQSIAFLLPQSGRFAKAAEMIKQGFQAAYQQSSLDYQPTVRFYDTSSNTSTSLYQQAISEGAELIIGPLQKENIRSLIAEIPLTTPVLALNHIEGSATDNLFQFGLSPIDEIMQLTQQAKDAGHRKALVFVPKGNQGQRMADYFTKYWQEQGGKLLEVQYYNARQRDFSAPIKRLLNLNGSKSRFRQLKKVLSRRIHFTTRRRQDVDVLFLSASTRNARSIYPQLRFHRATKLPVYATSTIYKGYTKPALDRDLNSIQFCDIPWLFPQHYQGNLSKQALRHIWKQRTSHYQRLVALGIDSFQLLDQLENLGNQPFSGATGVLSLNSENRITRELSCAQFNNGQIILK